MNAKITVVGGIAYYLTTFIMSMVTGPLIHQGLLLETYKANALFWRPQLNMDPPDMAALMPYWITTGIIYSLVVAALYSVVRPALSGAGWLRGVKFGIGAAVLTAVTYASLHGVFNLPPKVWIWWSGEGLAMYAIGGAVLGLVAEKLAPAAA